jgi:hypothetical protein
VAADRSRSGRITPARNHNGVRTSSASVSSGRAPTSLRNALSDSHHTTNRKMKTVPRLYQSGAPLLCSPLSPHFSLTNLPASSADKRYISSNTTLSLLTLMRADADI